MASAPKVVGFLLAVFLLAIALPTLIASPDGEQHYSFNISESGDEERIPGDIAIYVEAASPSTSNATITVVDIDSHQAITKDIAEGEEATYSYPNGDIHVYNVLVGSDSTELHVHYNRTYGWSDESKAITEQFPLIMAGLFVVVLLGFVGVMAVRRV